MINIVYLLHVSATHVAILREVTDDGHIVIIQKFVNQCTHFFPFKMVTRCMLPAYIIRYTL